jgi:RNA polymerase sigma factor (sigma-70 family)
MKRDESLDDDEGKSGMKKDAPPLKKDWIPDKESFDKLLACLDEDRERAGEMYISIRAKLVKFFEWRGSQSPDDNADETINRVMRKISEGEKLENIQSYSYGVARLLFMEILKEQQKRQRLIDSLPPPITFVIDPTETEDREKRNACLDSCLSRLPDEKRLTFKGYFGADKRATIKRRKHLAEQLKIPLSALRIRVHRTRMQLEGCVTECLQNPAGEMQ